VFVDDENYSTGHEEDQKAKDHHSEDLDHYYVIERFL
jgi:hypothetical protein